MGIFEKLLGKKNKSKEVLDQPDPLKTHHEQGLDDLSPGMADTPSEPPRLIVGYGHSSGRQRDHNEDAIFTLTTNLVAGDTIEPFGLYIIADGMGGHQYGEVASAVSVRGMATHVLNGLYLPWLSHSGLGIQESLHEVMQEGILETQQMIIRAAPGGGTTLTAALVLNNRVTITHVGDSRAYLIHPDGKTQILTHDHTLVKRLEELGQLTSEEAAIHPQRNVLYRALGQGDPIEPDVDSYQLPESGYLLICSDGLWGVVPHEKVIEVVIATQNPQEACNILVDSANAAGGPDNISVILVRLPAKFEG
jgi:serine/threonine protein phosphatase PrpC